MSKIFDYNYYGYKGFYEGDYIWRHYLPKQMAYDVDPRDLLAVYSRLRAFTPNLTPYQRKPSNLRKQTQIDFVHMAAGVMADHPIRIIYRKEALVKDFDTQTSNSMVKACHDYATDVSDISLSDNDWQSVARVHDLILQQQQTVKERLAGICEGLVTAATDYDISITYQFYFDNEAASADIPCFNLNQLVEIKEPDNWQMHIESTFQQNGYPHQVVGIDIPDQFSKNYLFMQLLDLSPIPLKHLVNCQRIEYEISVDIK